MVFIEKLKIMKVKIVLLSVLVVLTAIACNQTTKEKANVSNASGILDPTGADTLVACHHSSKVNWIGFKPGGQHNGTVNLSPGGIILVKNNQLVGADINIDLTTIANIDLADATYNAKLVGHLKSPDFFNVDTFPTANFKLTGLIPLQDSLYTHLAKGELTMKAITNPIEFRAKISISGKSFAAESEPFMLDRTLWHVNYGSKSIFKELKDSFINDEFSIQISLASM
jgi:polyisoprenoid-binding protein YceI